MTNAERLKLWDCINEYASAWHSETDAAKSAARLEAAGHGIEDVINSIEHRVMLESAQVDGSPSPATDLEACVRRYVLLKKCLEQTVQEWERLSRVPLEDPKSYDDAAKEVGG